MSTKTERRQRDKSLRRTISGAWVPTGHEPAPPWLEIVQAPKKEEPVVRTGDFYQNEVVVAAPEIEHPFSGRNRSERRRRLRHTGMLGMFSRELHLEQGIAWADNLEAKRLMRERATAARLAKKYEALNAAAS